MTEGPLPRPGKPGDPPASKALGPPCLPTSPESPLHARRLPLPAGPGPGPSPVTVPDRARQDAWVARLKGQDPDALREVVQAYAERLGAVVAGILRDTDAVEDVVQETFAKAWLRIGSFQGDSGLYTWLYRVAVNAAKDHLKRRRRRPALALEERHAAGLAEAGPAPLEGIERREARLAVRRAIAALPPKFRAVLALREIEGMAYHEIAEVLGLSLGTVESRLFRARRRLRDLLSAPAAVLGTAPRPPETPGAP